MKNRNRILGVITLYFIITLIYILFFLLGIESIPYYVLLTIGSVALLSTSTIYTVIHSKENTYYNLRKKKFLPEKKSTFKKRSLGIQANDLIEDYFEANPLVDNYADSDESYENFPRINEYIFSLFKKEELAKINLLDLSKMDKIFFIRELTYFDPNERSQMIEAMIKDKALSNIPIEYNPPQKPIVIDEKIRVYVRSLIEPGEKTKIMIIETSEFIKIIKQKIAVLFDYNPENFFLSSGGLLLEEDLKIIDYTIEDDDEIALIPIRKINK